MSNSEASASTSMLRAQDAEGFASNEPVELTDISAPDSFIDNFHLDICTPASSMEEIEALKQSSMLPAEWMCSLLSSKLALFKLALVPLLMSQSC